MRWINDNLQAVESFIGVYNVDNIKVDTLVATIKDVLVRMNLFLQEIRGQCYGGASNMAGSKTGVAFQMQKDVSKAVFSHCCGHSLQLAVTDTI